MTLWARKQMHLSYLSVGLEQELNFVEDFLVTALVYSSTFLPEFYLVYF